MTKIVDSQLGSYNKSWRHSITYKTQYLPVQNLSFQANNGKTKTKITNKKPVVVLQLKLLTGLGPRKKMFSWKCNYHVRSKDSAKKLNSTSDIKQTVSVKKTSVKRIY